MHITRIGSVHCHVGEGPVWDTAEQALYFVDITQRLLWRYEPAGERFLSWQMPSMIGSQARSLKETTPLGGLFSLDTDLSVKCLDRGFGITNGPCWSPDGRTFYFADSLQKNILAYDYHLASGSVAKKCRRHGSQAPCSAAHGSMRCTSHRSTSRRSGWAGVCMKMTAVCSSSKAWGPRAFPSRVLDIEGKLK